MKAMPANPFTLAPTSNLKKMTGSQLQLFMLKKFPPFSCTRGYSRAVPNKPAAGSIVISGISGRFPKANSTKELNERLLKGEELLTETTVRWNDEKLPKRSGFLNCLDKFDAGFFNVHPRQANQTDPQIRLLLEAAFEAIVDAGVNPMELRGTETAVFSAAYGGEAADYRLFHRNKDEEGYHTLGTANFMIASRIAFSLDLRGLCSHVSTGCSSTFTALEMAMRSIEAGKCEAAIVTGSSVQLNPFLGMDYMTLKALSPDGRCKAFDESADGYSRSEAAVAILIQREADARRSYARIRAIRSSSDGFKHVGIMHPTRVTQEILLEKAYEDAGVDPADVSYFEAHGTGTPAGDPEEIRAVHRIFCEGKGKKKREKPLLIGSLKTNLGHAECAAGLCGVAKVIGAMQSGIIPGNLFFNRPNPQVMSLFDGSLKVLTQASAYDGGIVGISSMGIGGSNAHLILEPGSTGKLESKRASSLPTLLPISGRSEQQVAESIAEASEHADKPQFVYLLQKAFEKHIPGHNARGFGLCHTSADGKTHLETTVVSKCTGRPPAVWVIFPGMGSQWSGMCQDLLKIEPFAQSMQRSRMTLRNLGVDLDHLLKVENQSIFTDIQDAFIAITAIQIAMWDTLKELGIRPDGFIGHSAGECLCAYADGCYTAEETLEVVHARGRAMKETQEVEGGMSTIGMSPEEIQSRLPQGIQLACYNGATNVTISGELQLLTSFTKKIKEEGRLAAMVNCCGTAAHSSHVRKAAALIQSYTKDIIKDKRPRSPRWISTSIPEAEWGSDLGKFASPEYLGNNVVQPVLFHQALQHVPAGAVVIEISPNGFFQALLTENAPNDSIHVALMSVKARDKLCHFFQSVGKLYTAGVDVGLEKLYPCVSTPVPSNVPSLSHLVKWDHSVSWRTSILELPLDMTYESVIDIEHPNYAYLAGHKFDGRVLMPATGLVCAVWSQLGDMYGRDYERCPVQFTNVVLTRATILSPGTESTLVCKINSKSGLFTVEHQGDIVATGKIQLLLDKPSGLGQLPTVENSSGLVLTKEDVYKEFTLRGCSYLGLFQGIETVHIDGRWADIAWKENWTCFLDAMLQTAYLCSDSRQLGLPVDFEKITIHPVEFTKNFQRTLDETGKNLVRVFHQPNQRRIIGPGIEIKGLEWRTVPRLLRSGNLAYERHTFCPFFNEIKQDNMMASFEELVDLMLENQGEKQVTVVVDVFTSADNSLALDFQRILSRKPGHECTISMITLGTEAEKLKEDAKVVGSVVEKETQESLIPQAPADIVLLDTSALLPLIVPTVKTNGFILVHSTERTEEHDRLLKISTKKVEGKTLDLYRKVELKTGEIVHVSVDSSHFAWVAELQEAILKSKDRECRIFVTSQRDADSGILGLVNCLRLEDGGEKIRSIFDPQGQLSLNFEQPDVMLKSIITRDLFVNVQKNGTLGSYRHVSFDKTEYRETTSTAKEAFLGTARPADLSSFCWMESPLPKNGFPIRSSSTPDQEPSLKRYQVAYAPLNFRDVLLATNAIPVEPEKDYSGPYLGLEFSGFDPQGNRVMGICHGDGLATSLMTDPRYVWPVPQDWTLEEAATVPVAYSTVLYAFHTRANLEPGQTVLIHAGAGGVGQAAISVALGRGCQVFTTVGSPEKRDYIKKIFPQLTDDFIGNSRDTSFEGQVMEVTNGRGVDVALNSLAGDKLIATARCVALNGSFLEIGVFDAFMNTPLGLRPLLKNINVCGVELDHVIKSIPGYDQTLRQLMEDGIKSGAVKPLPRRVYECKQAEEAFRLMASGQHVGKLVVKIRDESDWKEPLNFPPVIKKSYFAPHKTYLIVGGLGGLGLEVAGWMVERGARRILLSSRSGPTTGYQGLCLRRWRQAGVHVETPTVDLTDRAAAELYLRNKLAVGEIFGGIFNSAMVLRDGEFSKQTAGNFQQVSGPKGNLTEILDEISRELSLDLDYFVAFSSVVSGRGHWNLTNYGWANSSMERICERRREDGLHGLAIQWGMLREVGVVAEKLLKGVDEAFELNGIQTQSVQSCLEVLDAALQQPFPIVSSCVVAQKGAKDNGGGRVGLCFRMEKIFGIADLKAIPADRKLSELGLDSLVAVELKQTLERDYDILVVKEHIHAMTVGDILAIDAGTFDVSKLKGFGSCQEIYVPFMLHKTALVPLKFHPSGRNAFIVHGTDGGCNYYKGLASRLEANVYGLQFMGKDGWNSIPELASLYVNEIKLRQPRSPFTIIGFSGGTAIAFEIALKLQKLNETVQNLIFLEGCPSYEPRNLKPTFALDFLESLNVLRNLSQDSVQNFESALTGDLGHDFLEILKVLKMAKGYELLREESDAYIFLTQQLASHVPCESFKGDIVLIQATEPSITLCKSTEDYDVGKCCTGQVLLRRVTGNHLSFLNEEHVDETAGVLNAFLDE